MTYGGSTNATFVGTGTLSTWGIDYEGDFAIFHQVDQVWTAFLKFDHLFDLDEINEEFHACDIALVLGANDVTNPAAKSDPGSPIYGMPILNVQDAEQVIVVKRGMATGFAGIENELFYLDKTSMLFGDAKSVLSQVVTEVKGL